MDLNQYVIIIALILAGIILIIYLRSHKKQINISNFIVGITFVLFSQVLTLIASFYENTAEGIILSQFTMVFFSLGVIFVFLHYEILTSSRPNYPILILQCAIVISIFISWSVLPYQYFVMKIPINLDNIYNISFWDMPASTTKFALSFNLFLGLIQFVLSFSHSIRILSRIYKISKNNSVNTERRAMIILLVYRIIFIINLLLPISANRSIIVNNVSTIALMLSIVGLLMLMFNYIVHPDYLYLLPIPIHSIMMYNSTGLLIYDRKVDVEKILKEDVSILMSGTLTAIQMMVHEVLGSGSQLKFIDVGNQKILFSYLPQDKAIIVIIAQQDTKLFKNSIQRFSKNIPEELLNEISGSLIDLNQMQGKIDILVKKNFPFIQFK